MEPYEIGSELSRVEKAKVNMEAYAKQLLSSIPEDDAFAKQAAENQLAVLMNEYQGIEAYEVDLRNNAKSLLMTGKYRFEGPNWFPKPGEIRQPGEGVPETKDKIAAHVGFALGVKPEKVDVNSGVPLTTRLKAAFFSAEKKPDFYKSEFGDENVFTMNIDGKPVNFIKQGDKIVMADEHDFTASDIAEAGVGLASEAPAIIGSAVATASAAPSGPAAMAIASGAGYTAGGTATDLISQALLMKEGNRTAKADILGKRATEAMIGMPFEYGTGRLLQPIAKRTGKGYMTDTVKVMDDAVRNLEKRGKLTKEMARRLDPFVKSTEEIQTRMTQIAQKSKDGGLGRTVFEARQALQDFRDMFKAGEAGIPGKMFDKAAKNMMQAEDRAIAAIKSVDYELGTVLEKEAKKKTESLLNPISSLDTLGSTVKNLVKEAEKAAIAEKNSAYDSFYRQASNVKFDPEELANFIQANYAKSGSTSSPVVEKVINELRKRKSNAVAAAELQRKIPTITDPVMRNRAMADLQRLQAQSGPLSALDFQNYHRAIKEDVPSGMFVAPTGSQVQGAQISDALGNLFQARIKQEGLSDAWEAARLDLVDRLKFKGSAFKALLKETPGGFSALTDTQATQKLLSDPQYVDDFLASIKASDPQNGARLEEQMRFQVQNAYLEQLGVGRDIGTGVKPLNFDDAMVTKLWGVNKNGQVNEAYGKVMVDKMKQLNQELLRLKIDPAKVTKDDIGLLQGVLSKDGINEAIAKIAQRSSEAQKLEAINNNKIMKLAISAARSGRMDLLDLDAFPKAIFAEENTGRVADLVQYLDKPAKEALKADTMKHFFRRYDIGAIAEKNDFGYTPWAAEVFLSDIKKNPALAKNLAEIIGKDSVDELVEMSTLALTVRPVVFDKNAAVGLRFVANPDTVSTYLGGNVQKAVQNAYLATAYNMGNLMPTVRSIVGKRVSKADYEKNMAKMAAGVFGTARGLENVFMVGRKDPQFLKWVAEQGLGPDWLREQLEFQEQYGTDTGLDMKDFLPE